MTDEACPSLKPTWGKPRRMTYPEFRFIGIPTEMIHISVTAHDAGANSIRRETHGAQTSREYDIESSISYRFL